MRVGRIGPAAFRAVAGSGGELIVDGAPEIGGEGRGMRPMELLAQRARIVRVHGRRAHPDASSASRSRTSKCTRDAERKDATPAPFVRAHLRFVAHGGVNAHKLERAVALAVEKYCSVSASLAKEIVITHEAVALPAVSSPHGPRATPCATPVYGAQRLPMSRSPVYLASRTTMEGQALARGFDALQAVLGLVFVLSGTPKLVGSWRMRALFDHLRVPDTMRQLTGMIELGAGLGLWAGFVRPEITVPSALIACPVMLGGTLANLTSTPRHSAWLTTALLLLLCLLVAYVRSQ